SGFRTIDSSGPAPTEERSGVRACDADPIECKKDPLPDWEPKRDDNYCDDLCDLRRPIRLDPPLENFPSQLPLNAWGEFWECFMFRSAADRRERQDCENCVNRECKFDFDCCNKNNTGLHLCLGQAIDCRNARMPACELAEDRETRRYCSDRLRESLESCECLEEIWQLPTLDSETPTP
ncbi:MAG: hypothetical protein ACO3LE_10850, partial [Bdellovibrionota bacterium]